MLRQRPALGLALTLGLGTLGLGTLGPGSVPALAQDEAAPEGPREARLTSGFTPDPVVLAAQTRGTRPLNELAAGCRGYVGTAPDAVLTLESAFGFLRLFVIAPSRVTLAVRDATGRWHCSGRPLDGVPREEGSFAAGRLEVFVGSVERTTQVPFELRVTEFHSVRPAGGAMITTTGASGDHSLAVTATEGRFGTRRLRRGFLPDPRIDEGESGGTVDARGLGVECEGYVEEQPSHVLTLVDDLDYFRLQLGGAAGQAALLVRTPAGRWLCHAPGEGNARVDREAWPEGVYRVWVGSRERTAEVPYQLCYTESRIAEGGCVARSGARGARPSRAVRPVDEEGPRVEP